MIFLSTVSFLYLLDINDDKTNGYYWIRKLSQVICNKARVFKKDFTPNAGWFLPDPSWILDENINTNVG